MALHIVASHFAHGRKFSPGHLDCVQRLSSFFTVMLQLALYILFWKCRFDLKRKVCDDPGFLAKSSEVAAETALILFCVAHNDCAQRSLLSSPASVRLLTGMSSPPPLEPTCHSKLTNLPCCPWPHPQDPSLALGARTW